MSLQVTCVKVTANKMNKEILKRSAMIDFLLPTWLSQTPELKRKKFLVLNVALDQKALDQKAPNVNTLH